MKDTENKKNDLNEKSEKECYSCKYCEKLFYSPEDQNSHMQSHLLDAKDFTDQLNVFDFTKKKTEQRENLTNPKSQMKEFKCDYSNCERIFNNFFRLETHKRVHVGVKPFQCQICFKSFNENGNLKTHLRIHSGERPYKCEEPDCESKFKTLGQLRDHKTKHSKKKPFSCIYCKKCYTRKSSLKSHNCLQIEKSLSEVHFLDKSVQVSLIFEESSAENEGAAISDKSNEECNVINKNILIEFSNENLKPITNGPKLLMEQILKDYYCTKTSFNSNVFPTYNQFDEQYLYASRPKLYSPSPNLNFNFDIFQSPYIQQNSPKCGLQDQRLIKSNYTNDCPLQHADFSNSRSQFKKIDMNKIHTVLFDRKDSVSSLK